MSWNRVGAIIGKDIREVISNKMVLLPMALVPVLLCVLIPAVLLTLAFSLDISVITGADLLKRIIPLYRIPAVLENPAERVAYIFLNYTFVPFFMIIPVMVSSIVAANSVVGEKERKTLETLLYTPVTNGEFFAAKLLSSFIPAVVIAWVSFILYFLATNAVSLAFRGILILRSWIWLPSMLLLSPAVALLGLSVTLFISIKAKTYMEAQQLSGLVVLPFLALIGVQLAGIVVFNPVYVVILSIGVLVVSYLAITRLGPRFSRERIISTL
jgi:ABC-type transport system involved in multi-copper enzyme maturation permease subunit